MPRLIPWCPCSTQPGVPAPRRYCTVPALGMLFPSASTWVFPLVKNLLKVSFSQGLLNIVPIQNCPPSLPLSCSFPHNKNHLFTYYLLDSLPVFTVISCGSFFRRSGLRSGFTDGFRACIGPCTKCKVNKYVLSE